MTQQFHPNMRDDEEAQGPTGGLYCFMNCDRVCGPDCMAFLPDAPPQEDYRGQPWAHCLLLVNAHRGGKHLAVLASTAADISSRARKEAADRQRVSQPSPPTVK